MNGIEILLKSAGIDVTELQSKFGSTIADIEDRINHVNNSLARIESKLDIANNSLQMYNKLMEKINE